MNYKSNNHEIDLKSNYFRINLKHKPSTRSLMIDKPDANNYFRCGETKHGPVRTSLVSKPFSDYATYIIINIILP